MTTHRALDEAAAYAKKTHQTQEGLLQQILARIDESLHLSSRTKIALNSMSIVSRLIWLMDFGKDVASKMSNVQVATFNIYR